MYDSEVRIKNGVSNGLVNFRYAGDIVGESFWVSQEEWDTYQSELEHSHYDVSQEHEYERKHAVQV